MAQTQQQIEAQARIDANKAKLAQQQAGQDIARTNIGNAYVGSGTGENFVYDKTKAPGYVAPPVTPLQAKVDAIQAKVDAQNAARKQAEYTRLADPTQNPNINNLKPSTGAITPLPNVYNPATATAGQQVAAQNLTNKGIDPTKLGTGVGENYQPYQANTQGTSVPGTTTQPTPGVTGTTGQTPGDDGIWQYDELSPENKAILDADPLAREQFELIAKQGGQNIVETVDKTMKALAELRKRGDFDEEQARINLERMNIQNKAGERQLRQGIYDAESNTYYSSLSSAPSKVANTAAGARIKEMATQFDEFVQLNSLQGDAYTKQVAENARRIQDDLNDKLGKTLTESLQNIDRAIADGTVLTDDQLMKVYKDNKDAMLKAFPQLTNFAVQQMSDLTNNFMNTQKEARARQDIFKQGANTYNQGMSQVKGFAVDGNGNPILDTNGQQIVVPKDAPIAPQFDEKTGQLITFSTNENGTIVGSASQVQGYKAPPSAQPQVWGKFDETHVINQATGEVKPIGATGTTGGGITSAPFTPPATFSSRAAGQSFQVEQIGDGIQITAPENTLLGQCGAFANDYARNIQGYKPVGNSWASKLANDNSDVPVAGGLFMYNPSQSPTEKYGHIGVVEKVNPDGSFVAYDSNIKGNEKSNRRTIIPGSKEYNLIKSDGGFFDPTKVGGQKQASTQLPELNTKQQARVDKYALDFENEPIVKSFNTVMVQVDAFKNYMQDNSGSSDQAMVYAFAKIMDPESVVREGEYETVKKYSQGLLQKYKGEIEQAATGEGFLSETAKKAMLKTLEEGKLKSLRGSYDNIREQKIKQINQIVGGDYGDSYLSEYDYGSTSTPGQNMSTGTSNNDWSKA